MFGSELIDFVWCDRNVWRVEAVAFIDGEMATQTTVGVGLERPAAGGHEVVLVGATHRLEA